VKKPESLLQKNLLIAAASLLILAGPASRLSAATHSSHSHSEGHTGSHSGSSGSSTSHSIHGQGHGSGPSHSSGHPSLGAGPSGHATSRNALRPVPHHFGQVYVGNKRHHGGNPQLQNHHEGGGHHGGHHHHWGHHCYGPWLWFGSGFGGYWYGYYGDYGYGRYPARSGEAIFDLDVEPEDAEVWLDGERIGIADDFDGFPDYLYVPYGRHRIEFRLSGHDSWSTSLKVEPGRYYKFENKLRRGTGNEEELAEPADSSNRLSRQDAGRDEDRDEIEEAEQPGLGRPAWKDDDPDADSEAGLPDGDSSRHFQESTSPLPGTPLRIRITPKDAMVWLDGRTLGHARELANGFETSPGRHELVVMRHGYVTQMSTIEVKADGDSEIRIKLTPIDEEGDTD